MVAMSMVSTVHRGLFPRRATSKGTYATARRCSSVRCYAALEPEYSGRQFTLLSTTEDATGHLASMLALELRPGDAYCLKGDQRGGKTTFCQAFIRAAAEDPNLTITPPYNSIRPHEYKATKDRPVFHYDVGHVSPPSDAEREELIETFPGVVSLIEWAEQLREWGAAPEERLALYFRRLPQGALGASGGSGDYMDSNVRLVTVVPHTASWELRAGLLHAHLSKTGASEGLVVLSDDMAASLTAGLPECDMATARA